MGSTNNPKEPRPFVNYELTAALAVFAVLIVGVVAILMSIPLLAWLLTKEEAWLRIH